MIVLAECEPGCFYSDLLSYKEGPVSLTGDLNGLAAVSEMTEIIITANRVVLFMRAPFLKMVRRTTCSWRYFIWKDRFVSKYKME